MGLLNFLFSTTKQDTDLMEQIVIESVENLKKFNSNFNSQDLEAEAINLASYIYLKDDYRVDFQLDYFTNGLLEKVPSEDYKTADKVFHYMSKLYPNKYGVAELNHGLQGYKMNIQLAPDYGSFIKNYFIRAHKIGDGNEYTLFSSPRNCLWRNNEKQVDSPTQRDIYYKIDGTKFELMIPPFNPLVTGKVINKSENTIKCQSSDNKRTFVFHYEITISDRNLQMIEMFRNDKGDMVSYHKN